MGDPPTLFIDSERDAQQGPLIHLWPGRRPEPTGILIVGVIVDTGFVDELAKEAAGSNAHAQDLTIPLRRLRPESYMRSKQAASARCEVRDRASAHGLGLRELEVSADRGGESPLSGWVSRRIAQRAFKQGEVVVYVVVV